MYLLKRRLTCRSSVHSVKVESDQTLAARLWRAAQDAKGPVTTHIHVEGIIQVLFNLVHRYT